MHRPKSFVPDESQEREDENDMKENGATDENLLTTLETSLQIMNIYEHVQFKQLFEFEKINIPPFDV